MITDPVTLPPDAPVRAALDLMARYKISGVPIVDGGGKLVGILTNRDLRFVEDHDQADRAGDEGGARSSPLRSAPPSSRPRTSSGSTASRSSRSSTPRARSAGSSRSRTSRSRRSTPSPRRTRRVACASAPPSASGRTRSSEPRPSSPRASTCSSSTRRHGHSQGVLDVVKTIKGGFDIEVIGGNVVTADAVDAMAAAGADGVKVGVGPGCFAAGTRVLMADATYKDIEDIVAGRPGHQHARRARDRGQGMVHGRPRGHGRPAQRIASRDGHDPGSPVLRR